MLPSRVKCCIYFGGPCFLLISLKLCVRIPAKDLRLIASFLGITMVHSLVSSVMDMD